MPRMSILPSSFPWHDHLLPQFPPGGATNKSARCGVCHAGGIPDWVLPFPAPILHIQLRTILFHPGIQSRAHLDQKCGKNQLATCLLYAIIQKSTVQDFFFPAIKKCRKQRVHSAPIFQQNECGFTSLFSHNN